MTKSSQSRPAASGVFRCPQCRSRVEPAQDKYLCTQCGAHYPIICEIADFRLRSDPYLSLDEERDKALRLYEFGHNASFREMVAYYYSITRDVPAELATRYQAYIHNAPHQAADALDRLGPDPKVDTLLDLGCGTGGHLVAAAHRYSHVTGVDIALRWLVLCQKRLAENGVPGLLVCAQAEVLPFPDRQFTHVIAGDLIEHVYDPERTLREGRRQLGSHGKLWLSATNRYCIGPHPTTRIWGIGFLPRRLRSAVLVKFRGVDSLRFANLLSPASIRGMAAAAGFQLISAAPRQARVDDLHAYPPGDRRLIRAYQALWRLSWLHRILILLGPTFEMLFQRTDRRVTTR